MHSNGRPGKWVCTKPFCPRDGRAFSRKDNYTKHINLVVHGDKATSAASQPTSSEETMVDRSGESEKAVGCECVALREKVERLQMENEMQSAKIDWWREEYNRLLREKEATKAA